VFSVNLDRVKYQYQSVSSKFSMSGNTSIGASVAASKTSNLSWSVDNGISSRFSLGYCDPDVSGKTYNVTWDNVKSELGTDGLSCSVIVDELWKKSWLPGSSVSDIKLTNSILEWVHDKQLQDQLKQEQATIDAVSQLYGDLMKRSQVEIADESDSWRAAYGIVQRVSASMALKRPPEERRMRLLTQAIHEAVENGTPIDPSVIGVITRKAFSPSVSVEHQDLSWL
jgi:hypothetical protein